MSGLPTLEPKEGSLGHVNSKANSTVKTRRSVAVRQKALLRVEVQKVGVSIQDTVDVSDKESWKVNLAHIIIDANFLSRYTTYNKRCHTGNCFTAAELARLAWESERLVQLLIARQHDHSIISSLSQ